MDSLKMFVVTDTHYFARALGCEGAEYDEFMRYEQKCFKETQEINERLFDYLGKADAADIILIAGDLSFNGEKQSHLEFIRLLNKCKAQGKKIFVITAGHDYHAHPFAFNENGRYEPEGTKREELPRLYADFGFGEAIAFDRQSLSYVAQLSDNVRLLALGCDGDTSADRTYSARQVEWILEQTKKAREESQTLIAMNHYPLIAACPMFSFIDDAVMTNAGAMTDLLADEGVHLCFTGHMHNQSVKLKITPDNNRLWDVCTGSAIGWPAVIRLVELKAPKTVSIKTLPVPDFDKGGEQISNEDYFRRQFDMMINSYLDSLADNPAALLQKLGIKSENETLLKIMSAIGGALNGATFGGVCRRLFVKCPPEIRDKSVRAFLTEVIRNTCTGNAPYINGTPEYAAVMGILSRFAVILKNIRINGRKTDLIQAIRETIGYYGVDEYNCELILC